MASLQATLTALLSSDESTTLDFKQAQYPLANATDDQKSELIKDILAFANTTRDKDAYIIIGAKEHKGHRATIIGITDHLDDAHLQQLINTKTNRTITFTYRTTTIDGKQLGIIHIPVHQRFLYLKRDFGKLHANIVYLRHGSSTTMATPDDIARMGTTDPPTLDVQFAHHTEHQRRGKRTAITSTILHAPTQVPDLTAKIDILNGLFNRDYYRELITFATFDQRHKPLALAVTNTSSVTALDVHVTLTIPDPRQHVTISLDAPTMPEQLARTTKPKAARTTKRSITIERTKQAWHLTATIPKVQPQQTHYVRPVYLGATKSMKITISVTIHADNLPAPITTTLTLTSKTKERTVTLAGVLKLYKRN